MNHAFCSPKDFLQNSQMLSHAGNCSKADTKLAKDTERQTEIGVKVNPHRVSAPKLALLLSLPPPLEYIVTLGNWGVWGNRFQSVTQASQCHNVFQWIQSYAAADAQCV